MPSTLYKGQTPVPQVKNKIMPTVAIATLTGRANMPSRARAIRTTEITALIAVLGPVYLS